MRKGISVIGVMAVILFTAVTASADNLIMEVDNHDAVFTGTWAISTARILYYGDNYKWSACSGSTAVTATATYTAPSAVDVSGRYSVYGRWVVDPNRTTAAAYDIYKNSTDGSPLGTVTKNQEQNGGEWRLLGTYSLSAGDTPKVVLKNNCVTEVNGANVIADAVRWVKEQADAGDVVDSAGTAYAASSSSTGLSTTGASMISKAMSAPAAGQVMVTVSGYFQFQGATADDAVCSINTTAVHDANYQFTGSDGGDTSGGMLMPFSSKRVISVSAGSNTFYLFCKKTVGSTTVNVPQMTLLYVPTSY